VIAGVGLGLLLLLPTLGQAQAPDEVFLAQNDDKKDVKKHVKEDDKKDAKKHKRDPIDIKLCDFDQVTYRVQIDAKSREMMTVQMLLPCYDAIRDSGAEHHFRAAFGDSVTNSTDGFSVALQYNLDTMDDKSKDAVVQQIKLIKPIVVGGVFKNFYLKLKDGQSFPAFKFDLRADTTVYFVPDEKMERVTTIFGLDFSEKVDKVLAKVFMQEFVDARRVLGFAPPVSWGVPPPNELATFGITEVTGNLGFISFSILKDHVKSVEKIDQIVAVLQSFRNYIQYHIKCSKSYFHSRMRARCVALLKVLNRARVEDPEKDKTKGKKTISGKTFRRVV